MQTQLTLSWHSQSIARAGSSGAAQSDEREIRTERRHRYKTGVRPGCREASSV